MKQGLLEATAGRIDVSQAIENVGRIVGAVSNRDRMRGQLEKSIAFKKRSHGE
jgi:hypothetical protein